MKKIYLLLSSLLIVSGCSIFGRKAYDQQLKSPCVDNGGPCQHIPVNNWWLNDIQSSNYKYSV